MTAVADKKKTVSTSERRSAPTDVPLPPRIEHNPYELLLSFEGFPEEFVRLLLKAQCTIPGVSAGAIFALNKTDGKSAMFSVYPEIKDEQNVPPWVKVATQAVSASLAGSTSSGVTEARVLPLAGGKLHLYVLQVGRWQGFAEYGCFVFEKSSGEMLKHILQRLDLTPVFWRNYHRKFSAEDKGAELDEVFAILAESNGVEKFHHGGMALCNSVASRFHCERVALGMRSGSTVKLQSLNHVEKIESGGTFINSLEAAMEECFDQDCEIIWPAPAESVCINRFSCEYSERYGPSALLGLPLRANGEGVGVLYLQRKAESPFASKEAEALRLVGDLLAPRLKELFERDRWIGARLAAWTCKYLALAIGPKHTWVKIAAILISIFLAVVIFVDGDYRVSGNFVFNTPVRHAIPAPHEGFLQKVNVRPGDKVVAGETVLAELDRRELELELAKTGAERSSHLADAATALRDNKLSEAKAAKARARQSYAQMQLLQKKIADSVIRSPVNGTVLVGELEHEIGCLVEKGKSLFEVAPLDKMEAEIYVADEDISDISEKQTGELAPAGHPEDRIAFTVVAILPVAQMREQMNCFRVRVRLEEKRDWFQPGMEGVAKIDAGDAPYIWIWTRKAVNWVRMKLWI